MTAPAIVLEPFTPLHPTEILPPEIKERPRDRLRIIGQEEAAAYKAARAFGFSPSQIDNFRDCHRWWGFKSIEYRSDGDKAGASLGTECHSHWEAYLRDGTIPPDTLAGKVSRSTLKYLPLPGVAIVEGETKLWTPLGIFTTRIDFSIPDQGAFALAALGEPHATWDLSLPLAGVPLIGDHKSTANIEDYAKRPEDLIGSEEFDLPGDAQATGYAAIAHAKYGADVIDLFWSYAQTKGAKKALPVRARHNLTTLDRSLRYLWADVALMRKYKESTTNANDLPANPLACDKYGGCPHRARCALPNEQRNIAFMTSPGSLSSLLGMPGAPAPAASAAVAPALSAPAPIGGLLGGGLLGGAPVAAPVAPASAPAPVAAAPLSLLAGMAAAPPAAAIPAPVAAPVAQAPASVDVTTITAPVTEIDPAFREQCRNLAIQLFKAGREPPATANPVVLEEFAKIIAQARVNPPDAAPATGPLLGVPAPAVAHVAAPAPQAAAPELVALAAPTPPAAPPAATPEAPKTRKARTPRPAAAPGTSPTGDDPIALLEAALDAARDARNFGLCSRIAAVLGQEVAA